MALNAAIVWEVRPTNGSATNGGGFNPGASGDDLSIFDAAQYTDTDGVTDGTTTITSAGANWGTDVVGNVVYVVGGTGSITGGWYEIITRADASTITVDRSTGLTAGTGVTLNVGGAMNGVVPIQATYVAGNTIYIKNEAWNEAVSVSVAGTSAAPVKWIGYNSTRGDNPTGSNRPTLDRAGAAGDAWTMNGVINWHFFKNLVFFDALDDGFTVNTNSITSLFFDNCRFTGNGGDGLEANLRATKMHFLRCEFDNNTGNGFDNAQANNEGSAVFVACSFHDNGSNAITNCGLNCYFCLFYGNDADAANLGATGVNIASRFINNTFYANTGANVDGIRVPPGNVHLIINNIFSSNGAYGLSYSTSSTGIIPADFVNWNNYYANSTNNIENGALGANDQDNVDPGFTNAGSGDFSIGTNLKADGFPGLLAGGLSTGYLDIGAVQRQEAASGGGASIMTHPGMQGGMRG